MTVTDGIELTDGSTVLTDGMTLKEGFALIDGIELTDGSTHADRWHDTQRRICTHRQH